MTFKAKQMGQLANIAFLPTKQPYFLSDSRVKKGKFFKSSLLL